MLRTITQGIIGVAIANIDALIGALNFSSSHKAVIVALVMAVLSPIYAELGKLAGQEDIGCDYTEIEETEEIEDNGITID